MTTRTGTTVDALLPHVRDIRRGGSAAVDLCSVAAGRLDAFYERGLNYWDFAAGGLIAREAGALVGGLAGRTESTSMAVAAGPGLYQQLETFLTNQQKRLAAEGRDKKELALPEMPRDPIDPYAAAALVDVCLAVLNASEFVYLD